LSYNSNAPQVGSVRSDSTRIVKVNGRKTNRRKKRPCCLRLQQNSKLCQEHVNYLTRIKSLWMCA